ncbi:serine protein kinase RIO [Candidatus Woesearchaeota archaeon]|nr:serine protein kinase RIO [Candidatus Woesearchaeota archaeon]
MATKGKEWMKTRSDVFDFFTARNLFKLSSDGHFNDPDSISPVKIGKESNVFLAKKGDDKVILKIYRLETCDFNRMYDYIRFDPRYYNLKRNRRHVILTWVQKEFRNLHLARDAGVRVPTPYVYLNNILVMEFIGDELPARQLKDLYPKNPEAFAKKLIYEVKKLYKAGLIHGDLSSFNILNFNEEPVLIDFSQTTTLENTNAKDYLKRDIQNVVAFFKKCDLFLNEEKLWKEITGKKSGRAYL